MPRQVHSAMGLADIPPGPELAAALASVSLRAVANDQIVDVLRAQDRQLAHEQARMLATLVEVSRTTPGVPGPDRADEAYEWASGEVAAALSWTARAADREMVFAETVVTGLPLVFDALWAGRISRAKAWVFADHLDPATSTLSAEHVGRICAHLVPLAAGLTTGELAARLLRAIVAVDPDHAQRRYRRALRDREVMSYLDRDGTVTITAHRLAPDEATAAMQRLRALARAAKRAGHPARLPELQADLFCRLLNGAYHGHTEAEIIADLLGCGPGTDKEPAESSEPPAPYEPPVPSEPPAPSEVTTPIGCRERPDRPGGSSVRCGVEIRVALGTLLGLDDQPGEIPGLGPVLATVARALVTAQTRGAQWRFAVTDPDGYLILAGALRRRPVGPHGGRCVGGIVEIHVPAELLDQLTSGHPAGCGRWAGVIGEIAAQYHDRDQLLAALHAHPGAGFPHAALARHVQVRDRTCSFMGCRCAARCCELDHTRDHALGGSTTEDNIGPGCGRHHYYKHKLGWRLRQPRPGHFEWTSLLGHTYRTRGQPITPPPIPPHTTQTPDSDQHTRPPPPAEVADDEPPPF